jgi:predicted NBD/HSP70 family sugar kinase
MLNELRTRRVRFPEPTEYRILRMAREARRIARTEIASRTGLSKTTVSEITARFVDAGFLIPVGRGPSGKKGGRKREMLEFNPDAAYVIGVDIERTRTDVALTNLDATILRRTSFTYPAGSSPRRVLSRLVGAIRAMGSDAEDILPKAIGIGVGLPGVIDSDLGVVRVADTLKGWEGYALADHLENEFHLPLFVENDVKARTLGELMFGSGRNVRDAVYLWLGDGIGAGLVIDGRLHHGFTRSAGEIGYNDVTRPLRSGQALPLLYRGQDDVGELLSLSNIARALGARSGSPVALLVRGLRQRDRQAVRVMGEISDVIGSLSISIVNMLNPEVILLGGELFWNAGTLVEAIQQKVRGDMLPVPAKAVQINVATLREDGVLLGSVGHVLFDLFRPTREFGEAAPPPAGA